MTSIKNKIVSILKFESESSKYKWKIIRKNDKYISYSGYVKDKKYYVIKSYNELNETPQNILNMGKSMPKIFNQLKIISDRLGYYPMYFYKENSTISFSNSMLLLAKNNKTSLNYLGIAQYLSENYKYGTYACCDQNIVNEIKYIDAGTIYSIYDNLVKKEKYFDSIVF